MTERIPLASTKPGAVPPGDVGNAGPRLTPDPSFRVHCPVEVRFRDCDPMGHVNNAVYLTYLELARFAYWKAAEIGRLEGDVSYIIARVEIDFRASAKTGDVLDVGISVTGFGRTSFSMAYEIRDQDGHLIATARTVQVTYDYAAGASVPVSDSVRTRLAEFEGQDLEPVQTGTSDPAGRAKQGVTDADRSHFR